MNLKKVLLPAGILVLIATFACAQNETSKSKPAAQKGTGAATKSEENTLLWQVSGNGMQKPSYIFGTMHILCSNDIKLGDSLKGIIRDVDKIYFEVDMDDMMEMMSVMSYIRMNGNQKLSDLLTPEEYSKLKDYFAKNPSPIPLQMMESFKPMFISTMIEEQRMTCPEKNGMEQMIMNEAKPYKKEIKGLESMKFQASVFDSIPYQEQAKELVKSLDSLDAGAEQTKELIRVYRTQDLQKINELSSREDGGMEKYMNLLLYNRNQDWVTKIGTITTQGSYLFAVGAAHLAGERGVLSLLKKKGYTVLPVRNTF
ncbi:MAG: TraB/GumN family protein [Williamsia sp.]|nr:TraB/GumN family protein [Williamsia sp.]